MTEAEWLRGEAPKPLLGYLFARTPGRSQKAPPDERFRLFGVACCRRVVRVLGPGDQRALDHLEVYARGRLQDSLLSARRSHRSDGNAASLALSEAGGAGSREK